MQTESEKLAQKLVDDISSAPDRPLRAHELSLIQTAGRDLITALRKDTETRKWAVEKVVEIAKATSLPLDIAQIETVYEFIMRDREAVISKLEGLQSGKSEDDTKTA